MQSLSAVSLDPRKNLPLFPLFPYLPWSNATPDVMILVFRMLSFKPPFSLSFFTLIKRLFSSSLLSAIRVILSAYLRLLIFLLAILIPACNSSSPAFHMMYSAYKVNKQGDSVLLSQFWTSQLFHIRFWLTSGPMYRFLSRQVRWPGIPIYLRVFHSLFMIYRVKGFSIVIETEVDVFLEFPCFLYDSANVGNLISGSSAFSTPSLTIWKLFT